MEDTKKYGQTGNENGSQRGGQEYGSTGKSAGSRGQEGEYGSSRERESREEGNRDSSSDNRSV